MKYITKLGTHAMALVWEEKKCWITTLIQLTWSKRKHRVMGYWDKRNFLKVVINLFVKIINFPCCNKSLWYIWSSKSPVETFKIGLEHNSNSSSDQHQDCRLWAMPFPLVQQDDFEYLWKPYLSLPPIITYLLVLLLM